MNLNDVKPLQPLTHGIILIVGAKVSNFDENIVNHPRVMIWDSQDLKWQGKDLPYNVRVIFMTRWIGHTPFTKILKEARKKQITIFNPEGTGMIAKQVRELLDMNRIKEETVMTNEADFTNQAAETKADKKKRNKLHVLIPFIDFTKSYADNARILLEKTKELGISSTFHSLSIFVAKQIKRRTQVSNIPKARIPKRHTTSKLDVSVEILDNMIKELQDMREYLVAVTEENQKLKMRIEKFKKFLSD